MKQTVVPTRESQPKNVCFRYQGVGIGNVDSDKIESVSFETYIDERALELTTLRVELRTSESLNTKTFPSIPIDLCREFLEDTALLLDFIDNGGPVKGEPEHHRGFDLLWRGWLPIKNGTEVQGLWLALSRDGRRKAYASTPGGEGFYETGEKFDIERRPDQPTFALFAGLVEGKSSPESEAAIQECRDRLVALIDRTATAEKQAMREKVERFRETGDWSLLDLSLPSLPDEK